MEFHNPCLYTNVLLAIVFENKTHLGGKVGPRRFYIGFRNKESIVTQESKLEKNVTEIRQSIHSVFLCPFGDDLMTSDLWTGAHLRLSPAGP